MTTSALLHHLFAWEIAPGVARDDQDHAAVHRALGAEAQELLAVAA